MKITLRLFAQYAILAALLFGTKLSSAQYSKILDFTGNGGQYPGSGPLYSSLLSDGTYLYGTTSQGGPTNNGNIFKINMDDGSYTVLHNFNGADGTNPQSSLVSDGTFLYGVTPYGGSNESGVIFKINMAITVLARYTTLALRTGTV